MSKNSVNIRIDPSDVKQLFASINLQLHCCRYWKLQKWEFSNMLVPFWRLYHNTIPGATVSYKNTEIQLNAGTIVLIPPRTSFSTKLKSPIYTEISNVKGRRITKHDIIDDFPMRTEVDHLFIHFNAGMPLDIVKPDIYSINETAVIKTYLDYIKKNVVRNYRSFDIGTTLIIQKLIMEVLSAISIELTSGPNDKRIIESIGYIESNYKQKITNEILASLAFMATNSFARLFKQQVGCTVQQYIQRTRIEKACILLHHSDENIDNIAFESGFCDRFYFTKKFKEFMGISPAAYKKHHTMV